MSSQVENNRSAVLKDGLLYTTILLLCVGGIWAQKWLPDYDWAVYASIWVAVVAVSVFVFAKTTRGSALFLFASQAYSELLQVVWPSWSETKKVTMLVALLVGVMSIILWIVDMILSTVVTKLIG